MHPASRKIAQRLNDPDTTGLSVNLPSGSEPTSGVVASKWGSEAIIPGRPSVDQVDTYIHTHQRSLDNPNTFLGAWVSSGSTFLDISHRFNDRRAAIRFGKANAQRAAYDIDRGRDFRLRYEGKLSPEGTLFQGFRRQHAAFSRHVSEVARREVELDLHRAQYEGQQRTTSAMEKVEQGQLF